MKLRKLFKSLGFRLIAIMVLCWLIPTLVLGQYMGQAFFASLKEKTEAALASGAEHALSLTLQNLEKAVTLSKNATYDAELTQAAADYLAGEKRYEDFYRVSRSYLERKYGRNSLFTFAAFFLTDAPEQMMYNAAGYAQAAAFAQEVREEAAALGETLDTRCRFFARVCFQMQKPEDYARRMRIQARCTKARKRRASLS